MRFVAAFLLLIAGLLGAVGLTGNPLSTRVFAQSQASRPIPTRPNLVYCIADGVSLKLDLYTPEKPMLTPAPVVMFVHGGSWSAGDKKSEEGTLETVDLLSRGYIVASINYRLAPTYVFPAQIQDVKCAVRYLRAKASMLGIDPNRIGAWGTSAGGHLVSLLGTTDENADMEGNGGYISQSSRVQAVVDMYGRADLTTVPESRPDLLPIFGSEENLIKYSPVSYVTKDDPPFLILHGEQDIVVPFSLSQEFYDRLRAEGVPATLIPVENAGHGFIEAGGPISPTRQDITRSVGDFFDKYLQNPGVLTTISPVENGSVGDAKPLPEGGDTMESAPTGRTVRGIFLDYWRSHGGLAQQGYPISAEAQERSTTDHKPYTVQYFERAVFEYHPENPAPYDVLTSLLGAQLYSVKYPKGALNQLPNETEDSVLFEKTGHRLGGIFLEYWQQHGGLMQQGYPVSNEFIEKSALDGKLYTVQYFERAVFEYHPENDQKNQVLLSQLGTFKYRSKYGSPIVIAPHS